MPDRGQQILARNFHAGNQKTVVFVLAGAALIGLKATGTGRENESVGINGPGDVSGHISAVWQNDIFGNGQFGWSDTDFSFAKFHHVTEGRYVFRAVSFVCGASFDDVELFSIG
jgi:hypothetical protein